MRGEDHPFFELFDARGETRLREGALRVELASGEYLFHEGDAPDALYLVVAGRIDLVKELAEGRVESIAQCPAGEWFGELAVLDGSGRTTGARALGEAALLRVPSPLFLDVMARAPGGAALALMRRIVDHLRSANERFMSFKLAQEKLSLVGEMASSIVHDLRGPYSGIKLAIEEIEEQHQGEPETVELCEMVNEQVRRSIAMLEDLLQYARGVSRLERRRLLLSDVAGKFARLNRSFLEQSGVKLLLDVTAEPLDADEDKLLRAIQNLVNNAAEALAGRPGGEVRIDGRRCGERLLLSVTDNGPGMPEALRLRAFEPFVTEGKSNGTGLGLPIARTIVEAHGGSIALESSLGSGTRFTIQLPAAAEEA
ncbi:MAG: sensor histidine kinase [Vicinamibacteria bacterium]